MMGAEEHGLRELLESPTPSKQRDWHKRFPYWTKNRFVRDSRERYKDKKIVPNTFYRHTPVPLFVFGRYARKLMIRGVKPRLFEGVIMQLLIEDDPRLISILDEYLEANPHIIELVKGWVDAKMFEGKLDLGEELSDEELEELYKMLERIDQGG